MIYWAAVIMACASMACASKGQEEEDSGQGTGGEPSAETLLDEDLELSHLTVWIMSGPADGLYRSVLVTEEPVDCGDGGAPGTEPRFAGLVPLAYGPSTETFLLAGEMEELIGQSGLFHGGLFDPAVEGELFLDAVISKEDQINGEEQEGPVSGSYRITLESGSTLEGDADGRTCGGSLVSG